MNERQTEVLLCARDSAHRQVIKRRVVIIALPIVLGGIAVAESHANWGLDIQHIGYLRPREIEAVQRVVGTVDAKRAVFVYKAVQARAARAAVEPPARPPSERREQGHTVRWVPYSTVGASIFGSSHSTK